MPERSNFPPCSQVLRWIIHVDMDAFYASIEQRDEPTYRGKPVIVGADPQDGTGRGVVSAASYEARQFGIHSAMPISQAFRRCPQGIFLPVKMEWYQHVSAHIFSIFRRFTDLVEPLSLDEAFLDVTGSLRLFGTPEAIGGQIQRDIWEEVHLPASVGIAGTKFVAKVASDLRKPRGFVLVPHGTETTFLKDLGIACLWGAGPKTTEQLQRKGFMTIGDVARSRPNYLETFLGRHGTHLWELANGVDERPVSPDETAKSIGAETTFDVDTCDPTIIDHTLLELAQRLGQRLREEKIKAGTLTLKFRDSTFRTVRRTVRLQVPTNQDPVLYSVARKLLAKVPFVGQRVRLLGVSVSKLDSSQHDGSQLSLFDFNLPDPVTQATDAIRARFGDRALQRGSLLDRFR